MPGLPRPVAVNMGNPHLVFLVPDLAAIDVPGLGAQLERHPILPEGGNIGFAQLLGPDRLRLRVFERGAGLTLACGSGACAAMVAARRRGLVGDRVHLVLDGGEVEVGMAGDGAGHADRPDGAGVLGHAGAGAARWRLRSRS